MLEKGNILTTDQLEAICNLLQSKVEHDGQQNVIFVMQNDTMFSIVPFNKVGWKVMGFTQDKDLINLVFNRK